MGFVAAPVVSLRELLLSLLMRLFLLFWLSLLMSFVLFVFAVLVLVVVIVGAGNVADTTVVEWFVGSLILS